MKKIIFLCLVVILTPTLLFSQQIKLTNKTVSDKNSKTLYIGVDNELEVQCQTLKGIVPKEGVFLTQNNIKIRPSNVGQLTVVFLTDDGENPISFDVIRVPDPVPVIAGQSDNKHINKSLLQQSELTIKSSKSDDSFFENYKVVSFVATLNGINYQVTGNNFSSDLTSAITKSKTDDLIAITDIKGYNEEISKSININGKFSFKIK